MYYYYNYYIVLLYNRCHRGNYYEYMQKLFILEIYRQLFPSNIYCTRVYDIVNIYAK